MQVTLIGKHAAMMNPVKSMVSLRRLQQQAINYFQDDAVRGRNLKLTAKNEISIIHINTQQSRPNNTFIKTFP